MLGPDTSRLVGLATTAVMVTVAVGLAVGVPRAASVSAKTAAAGGPPVGSLAALRGPGSCVAVTRQQDCRRLRGAGSAKVAWVFPADGRSVYATSSQAVVVLRRDPVSGRLSQPAGAAGCISATAGCDNSVLPPGVRPDGLVLTVSPEGTSAYLGYRTGATTALLVLRRDPATGVLTRIPGPRGCVSSTVLPDCQLLPVAAGTRYTGVSNFVSMNGDDGARVIKSHPLQVDRAGRSLSLSNWGGVLTIPRDPSDGSLDASAGVSCFAEKSLVHSTKGCALLDVDAVGDAQRLFVPPEGSVAYYVSSGFNAPLVGDFAMASVIAFTRDPLTGGLSNPRGAFSCPKPDFGSWCALLSEARGMAMGPTGALYLIGTRWVGSLMRTSPDPLTPLKWGRCIGCGRGLSAPFVFWDVTAQSPDGRSLYIAAGDYDPGSVSVTTRPLSSITAFQHDPARGTLRQVTGTPGCWTDATRKGCGRALVRRPMLMRVSPDGRNLYVLALGAFVRRPRWDATLTVFARNPATGGITPLRGSHGCLHSQKPTRGCTLLPGLGPATKYGPDLPGIDAVLELSPDGQFVYTTVGKTLRVLRRVPAPSAPATGSTG